jgi:hypothetical protein
MDPQFRIGSNADPAFNLNADPGLGSQTNAHNADPDPGQTTK